MMDHSFLSEEAAVAASDTDTTDQAIVVVGGGLAGLSATIEATRTNPEVKVWLLDKEQALGGNSAKASSGINGVYTTAQRACNSSDRLEYFVEDTIKSGGGLCDTSLVHVLTSSSPDAISFLEGFGVDLSVLSKCGGHSHARTHRGKQLEGRIVNVGWDIMSNLIKYVKQLPNVTIVNSARAKRLIVAQELDSFLPPASTATTVTSTNLNHNNKSGSRVSGLVYEKLDSGTGREHTIRAKAVILATGGYSAAGFESQDGDGNESYLKQFAPGLAHLPTTNGQFATGDGIKLATEIGADIVDMDKVQIHPTGFIDPKNPKAKTKWLAPEALRACGGIMLNQDGKRFVNELGRRDEVSNAIFNNCKPLDPEDTESPVAVYLLLNSDGARMFHEAVLNNVYKAKGLVQKFANVKELCNAAKLNYENVAQTLKEYNSFRDNKMLDPFGKTDFPTSFNLDEEIYLMLVTPCIHYTMGGLRFNTEAQVLRREDEHGWSAIKGLYAAGEVTGGLHGKNRLAGNSLLECVVFGRIAGRNAAAKY